jgi:predicted MFS family arabinose efflux permease
LTRIIDTASLRIRADIFFGIGVQIIGIVFLARLIMDIGNRMAYPFILQFSTGLGLTIAGFGWLLFFRGLTGITGPIFGVWSDRYGRRRVLVASLIGQAIGAFSLAISQQWWAAFPMILAGLSTTAFIPAQQAYISDQVPYQKRGRALAAVEFAWSISAIVALPIVGWLIEAFGWRSPLLALSLLSLVGALIVQWQLPPAAERRVQTNLPWLKIKTIFLRGNVIASVGTAFLVFVAASVFITVWGIWLAAAFNFEPVMLGLVATAIGVAELTGAGLSSLFIDRVGKKRGSGLAVFLMSVAYILLPLTQSASSLAIAALVVMGTIFEFTIISLIALFSEQAPEARGTVLSLIFLGVGIGSAIAPPITTTLWEQYGLGMVCGVAAASLLAAFGLLWKFVPDYQTTP